MDRNTGANMWYVGWIMDYGDRKESFSYIFYYLCFDYYRDGVIILIAYRVNKQINIPPRL